MIAGASWGATARERAMALACDELLAAAPVRLHRAVSVEAPPAVVFRWLCQLKQAPYSYDLIDMPPAPQPALRRPAYADASCRSSRSLLHARRAHHAAQPTHGRDVRGDLTATLDTSARTRRCSTSRRSPGAALVARALALGDRR